MRYWKWLTTFLFVLTSAAPTLAQVDQGKIAGTVRDQQGAFVAGASVTVKNERTGEERTATSEASGSFLVANLKPSNYTIRVTKAGFATLEYTEMPLAVGQELVL